MSADLVMDPRIAGPASIADALTADAAALSREIAEMFGAALATRFPDPLNATQMLAITAGLAFYAAEYLGPRPQEWPLFVDLFLAAAVGRTAMSLGSVGEDADRAANARETKILKELAVWREAHGRILTLLEDLIDFARPPGWDDRAPGGLAHDARQAWRRVADYLAGKR
jgi:hypothetical protein